MKEQNGGEVSGLSDLRLIILLAVPNTKEGMNDHLQMLSEVSKRLAKKEVIERLKEEKDEDRLIRILLNP